MTSIGSGDRASGTVETTIDGDVAIVVLRRPPHNLAHRAVACAASPIIWKQLAAGCRVRLLSHPRGARSAPARTSAPTWRPTPPPETRSRPPRRRSTRRPCESSTLLFRPSRPSRVGDRRRVRARTRLRSPRRFGTNGWFQVNFVRLGIHPGFRAEHDPPPPRGARDVRPISFLSARRVGAEEAERIGLVERVVDDGAVIDGAHRARVRDRCGRSPAVAATRGDSPRRAR